jgi:hypothetical protein
MTLLDRHWRLVVVLAAALVAFNGVVRFPFSIIDDPSNVVNNPLVAHPLSQGAMGLIRTPAMGYPHTVTVLSFALDRQLFGVDPAYYHAVNVLIHIANIVLLYLLLLRFGFPIAWAWLPAAVFALHPIVAEPVSWVIGCKDLLATGFLLSAFNVIASGSSETQGALKDWRFAAAAGLCVLAIFSKPAAITAPLLLWLIVRYARPSWKRLDLVLMIAPIAVAGAFTVATGVPDLQSQGAVVERSMTGNIYDMLRAWTIHASHLVWPRHLLAEYERSSTGDPALWRIALIFLVSIAVAVWAWRRTSRGSIERMAVLFIPIAYAPVAGVLPTWHWTADSYFYLPLVGVVFLIAGAGARMNLERVPALWAIVPLFAFLSYQQTFTWSSGPATFGPVAAYYAEDPRPLNRLAFAYLFDNRGDEAAELFVRLDDMAPDFEFNRAQRAWAAYRRGESSRGDAIVTRCVVAADTSCLTAFWNDVMNGGIQAGRVSSGAIADAFLGVAETGFTNWTPAMLRACAQLLRQRGLVSQAQRAEFAAAGVSIPK